MYTLAPWRVRLTDPADVETYGDRWWVFDEAAVLHLPVDELIAIERETYPTKLRAALDDNRVGGILGELIALWIAMRIAEPGGTPKFADFKPKIMLTDWERIPAEEVDPGAPLDTAPPSSPSTETTA